MIKREYIENLQPYSKRTKLLLYALANYQGLKGTEVPYLFVERTKGTSKTVNRNLSFVLDFLMEVTGYMKDYASFGKRNKHIAKIDETALTGETKTSKSGRM